MSRKDTPAAPAEAVHVVDREVVAEAPKPKFKNPVVIGGKVLDGDEVLKPRRWVIDEVPERVIVFQGALFQPAIGYCISEEGAGGPAAITMLQRAGYKAHVSTYADEARLAAATKSAPQE